MTASSSNIFTLKWQADRSQQLSTTQPLAHSHPLSSTESTENLLPFSVRWAFLSNAICYSDQKEKSVVMLVYLQALVESLQQ